MASFTTNFHATLDELGDLVESWVDNHPIVLSAFAFPPERMVPLSRETLREVLARPDVSSLIFTESDVDPSWTAAYDAVARRVDHLRLNIGRLESKGLAESWLTTANAKPLWKKLNADLKKKTTAGATLIWEDGNTRFDRNARFTLGAKALAAAGTPLREFTLSTKFMYLPK